jgi:glycosyltransferase involved in cell wall biosynthesis
MSVNFSVLLLTHNEEDNIKRCLNALSVCDDIIVIDDLSTDNTVTISQSFPNVQIYTRKFDNFANQRNYALDKIEFKYTWILHLDADEVVTEDFINECIQLAEKDEKSAYWVPSKLIFFDKWIKHASSYPVYQMRFMKLGEIRFVQVGHGQRESESKRGIGYMKNAYLHYNFSKGLEEWKEKHNKYSLAEAIEEVFEKPCSFWGLFSPDKIIKRRTLKYLSHKICGRPSIRFLYLYILKKGFLDGMSGYKYCKLMSSFEKMIVLKKQEIKKACGTDKEKIKQYLLTHHHINIDSK